MDLKSFLYGIKTQKEREEFAARCGTTFGHMRNVSYGQKPCRESLAINIDRESGGAVPCEELRPDVDWAYLRNAGAKRKPKPTEAAA